MRKAYPITLATIDARIARLTTKLMASSQAQATRPGWTRPEPAQLRRDLNRRISKIIARALIEDPAWPPASALQPTEQRTLSRVAATYVRQQTAAILSQLTGKKDSGNQSALNNREATNKRLTFSKKFLAALLAVYAEIQYQQNQKKNRKKLKRLALLASKRAAEEMPYHPVTEAPPAPNSVLIPKTTPAPQYDYELPQHLHVLGLPLGAGHAEIKAAFEKIDAAFKELQLKFEQNTSPTREEQETYQQAAAVHELAKIAYTALMQVDNARLVNLTQITETEIRDFAQNLQPQMPNLMNQPATLQELKGAVLAANIQAQLGSDAEPVYSSVQLQKIQLTLEKLEHHYQANPSQLIDMREFLPAARQTLSSPLTQTLTPRGH